MAIIAEAEQSQKKLAAFNVDHGRNAAQTSAGLASCSRFRRDPMLESFQNCAKLFVGSYARTCALHQVQKHSEHLSSDDIVPPDAHANTEAILLANNTINTPSH